MKSLVFPGQGSQYVGMGKDLLDSFPEIKVTFDEVNDALDQNLSGLMFDGPEDKLILTENAQPAIMSIGIATIEILKSRGFVVDKISNISAGHSLGEYTSLTALRSLSLTDTAKLLRLRGRAMQNSFPNGEGAMAAILGLDIDEVIETIESSEIKNVCQVANDNAPGQIVISGEINAVNDIITLLKDKGAKKAIKLPVSAPFHCELMNDAKDIMKNEIYNAADDLLERNLSKSRKDRYAIIDCYGSITYTDLYKKVNKIANFLKRIKLKKKKLNLKSKKHL